MIRSILKTAVCLFILPLAVMATPGEGNLLFRQVMLQRGEPVNEIIRVHDWAGERVLIATRHRLEDENGDAYRYYLALHKEKSTQVAEWVAGEVTRSAMATQGRMIRPALGTGLHGHPYGTPQKLIERGDLEPLPSVQLAGRQAEYADLRQWGYGEQWFIEKTLVQHQADAVGDKPPLIEIRLLDLRSDVSLPAFTMEQPKALYETLLEKVTEE